MKNIKLSIIIVSWNVKDDLVRCLLSIKDNQPCITYEVIVVDNASKDGTTDSIRPLFPSVHIINNGENRGFAAGNNRGIELSKGQYILLLNPDTIIHQNSLDTLVEFMEANEDVGACGPELLNPDGTVQASVRCFPSFRGALHRHTSFKSLTIFKNAYKKWMLKDFKYDKQADVDQVMGAALLTRRTVLDKVGKMDETFFMYYEEVDLCYRIKQAGWRVVFLPEARITHVGGRSSEQIPVEKHIMAMTSLLKFFRKHRGRFPTVLFNVMFIPGFATRELLIIILSSIGYLISCICFSIKQKNHSAKKLSRSAKLLWYGMQRVLS